MKDLEIPFPKKEYQAYKNRIKYIGDIEFTEYQVKLILLLAIEDFLVGKISVDNLSSIANEMIDISMKNNYFILDILESASELSFYVRKPELILEFKGFLDDTINFYETEKDNLEKIDN